MNAHQILITARDYIVEPHRWAKGYFAQNLLGKACDPRIPAAVCWSAGGAVIRASMRRQRDVWTFWGHLPRCRAAEDATRALTRAAGMDIEQFNDARDHAEIVAVFDRAIKDVNRGWWQGLWRKP
jgi:hypothetical protein